jgi:hypothetical protein
LPFVRKTISSENRLSKSARIAIGNEAILISTLGGTLFVACQTFVEAIGFAAASCG